MDAISVNIEGVEITKAELEQQTQALHGDDRQYLEIPEATALPSSAPWRFRRIKPKHR